MKVVAKLIQYLCRKIKHILNLVYTSMRVNIDIVTSLVNFEWLVYIYFEFSMARENLNLKHENS